MALTTDDDVTAAELAIGLLDGVDRSVALRRVLSEPDFAQAVEVWRARFAALYSHYPAVAPPAWIERRLLGLGGDARPWRWATAAASLLAASLALVLVLRPAESPQPQVVVTPPVTFAAAMTPAKDEGGTAFAALFDANRGQVRVAATVRVPAGRVAELWRIGRDGVPHSLGLLQGAGTTAVQLRPADRAALAAGATLAISIEPEGGSPTRQPTGPVVATGPLTRI